jgi:ATP-binding cassette, subfamily F, member 3
LDIRLNELDTEGDDKRFVDAREELSSRLAEVHAQLAEMDAASGPARAAALLAGREYKPIAYLLPLTLIC